MIKYSVIMPVYNAINFIEENLKMFAKLDRDDIELIIVNDGSTDNSINIIKTYRSKIKNLSIINQENRGVSYSRNIGIKNAKGKYVTFLDCDDSLEDNLFIEIDKIYAEDFDLIRYGFSNITKKHAKKEKIAEKKEIYSKSNLNKEIFKLIYTTRKFNTVWNQVIKREIILKNNIYFDTNHKYAEDFEFNRNLLNYVDRICFLPDCLYNYYINETSISRKEIKDTVIKCVNDSIEIHTQTYIDCKQKNEELLEDTFKNISLEFQTTIRRLFFLENMSVIELSKIFNKLRSYDQVKMLVREKEVHNWKSNMFIDNCIYKKNNYLGILFYKYYFKIKKIIKYILQ